MVLECAIVAKCSAAPSYNTLDGKVWVPRMTYSNMLKNRGSVGKSDEQRGHESISLDY